MCDCFKKQLKRYLVTNIIVTQLFLVSRAARPKPLTSPKLSLLFFILGSPKGSLKARGFALPRAPDSTNSFSGRKRFRPIHLRVFAAAQTTQYSRPTNKISHAKIYEN